MGDRRARWIWRFIWFSAVPFLTLLGVLLLLREDTVFKALGVLVVVAAAAALLAPQLIRHR